MPLPPLTSQFAPLIGIGAEANAGAAESASMDDARLDSAAKNRCAPVVPLATGIQPNPLQSHKMAQCSGSRLFTPSCRAPSTDSPADEDYDHRS
jgi:hypothetical protein